MILCFITLWRGNIAMAMGIHFAVNIFAILIIGQGTRPLDRARHFGYLPSRQSLPHWDCR
jgi:membrane protease YdiL (CAAX protease family)